MNRDPEGRITILLVTPDALYHGTRRCGCVSAESAAKLWWELFLSLIWITYCSSLFLELLICNCPIMWFLSGSSNL
jgi:hypothetical protein